jgi:hypothetical protein
MSHASVGDVVTALRIRQHVPLSFVEASPAGPTAVDVGGATVGEVLASLVRQAAGYDFGLIGDHLFLYSKEPKFQQEVADLGVNAELRIEAANRLGTLLRGREGFERLGLPPITGDPGHPLYVEPISWHGTASLMRRLSDLAGDNPAVVVSISRDPDGDPTLAIEYVSPLRSLEVQVVRTLGPGASVQARVVGTDVWGEVRDWTAATCGTAYTSLAPGVVAVSRDGVVTALAAGKGVISARAHGLVATAAIIVVSDKPAPEK